MSKIIPVSLAHPTVVLRGSERVPGGGTKLHISVPTRVNVSSSRLSCHTIQVGRNLSAKEVRTASRDVMAWLRYTKILPDMELRQHFVTVCTGVACADLHIDDQSCSLFITLIGHTTATVRLQLRFPVLPPKLGFELEHWFEVNTDAISNCLIVTDTTETTVKKKFYTMIARVVVQEWENKMAEP